MPPLYYFSLYSDLRKYDKAILNEVEPELLVRQAKVIFSEYLDEAGDYCIRARADIISATATKIKLFEESLSETTPPPRQSDRKSIQTQKELLFIELLSYSLQKLKVYFERFKRSPMFVELEDEITR